MTWILNGAKPAGILGSTKRLLPTKVKFLSKTSTLPALKLVAQSRLASPSFTMVIPLYTAFADDLSATFMAELPELHARIMPSSLAKMNLFPPKSVVLLKTIPEGAPTWPGAGIAEGILTGGLSVLPELS